MGWVVVVVVEGGGGGWLGRGSGGTEHKTWSATFSNPHTTDS